MFDRFSKDFSILFSTKFYFNWKSVPTCAWHLIFCWPTGSAQCPPIYMTLGIPFWAKIRAHLCMTLDFWFTDWANPVSTYTWHWVYTLIEQKTCALLCMTLGFLLNNWASPVPTYTWHCDFPSLIFFLKKNRASLCMTLGIIINFQ